MITGISAYESLAVRLLITQSLRSAGECSDDPSIWMKVAFYTMTAIDRTNSPEGGVKCGR